MHCQQNKNKKPTLNVAATEFTYSRYAEIMYGEDSPYPVRPAHTVRTKTGTNSFKEPFPGTDTRLEYHLTVASNRTPVL